MSDTQPGSESSDSSEAERRSGLDRRNENSGASPIVSTSGRLRGLEDRVEGQDARIHELEQQVAELKESVDQQADQ